MNYNKQKTWAQDLLAPAGIQIDGPNPWDVQVVNQKVYDRVLAQGSLGFGESYMQGWWTCQAPDEFFTRLFNGAG